MEINQNWLADQVESSERVAKLESFNLEYQSHISDLEATIADLRGRLGVLECRLRAYELVESRMWRELVAKKEANGG